MQAATGRTVEVVGTIGRIIGTVNATTALLAETAAQQAAATQEIGRAIGEAAVSTTELAQHASGMSGRTPAAPTRRPGMSAPPPPRCSNSRRRCGRGSTASWPRSAQPEAPRQRGRATGGNGLDWTPAGGGGA